MAGQDNSELIGYTTIRIKNSTLKRLKYNDFYSDSISDKIDYLITYHEAAAEHYHDDDDDFLIASIKKFNREFWKKDEKNSVFEKLKKKIEGQFARGGVTYVTAVMTTEDSSGIEEKKLYVTLYRESDIIHKDMKRHPFALLITSRGRYKFYIPFNEDCLNGKVTLKQLEKKLEIPEWIEADLKVGENTEPLTVGIEKSYDVVIPSGV
ncbi:hypothetical protein [Methanoplanus endosymbiosus]|uniref:Uncharacterized protein n=1 Tax=Methanoplanus endosymbiosus TaxID=33865 RepID=A0A9E7TLM5_9EURY|nr:hypothetical protein [Methanoplanus endosymbiosus]UUX92521.1 hypothetical protein L6E24_14495 [Methanoplanus endosymbiosus]